MTVLTGEEIGYLIVRNGKWGPGGDKDKVIAFLDVAIAVALAESGGDTNATHKNTNGSTDFGLFQINSVHENLLAGGNWRDPGYNVEMARSVWAGAGNSFSPWSTYKSGAYKSHLGWGAKVYAKAQAAKESGDESGWSISNIPKNLWNGVTNITDPIGDAAKGPAKIVAGALNDVFKWLAKGALVVGATLLALLLLALGIWLLMSNTKTGKAVKDSAEDAALLAATKGAV